MSYFLVGFPPDALSLVTPCHVVEMRTVSSLLAGRKGAVSRQSSPTARKICEREEMMLERQGYEICDFRSFASELKTSQLAKVGVCFKLSARIFLLYMYTQVCLQLSSSGFKLREGDTRCDPS